jgi:hypothetical protein
MPKGPKTPKIRRYIPNCSIGKRLNFSRGKAAKALRLKALLQNE